MSRTRADEASSTPTSSVRYRMASRPATATISATSTTDADMTAERVDIPHRRGTNTLQPTRLCVSALEQAAAPVLMTVDCRAPTVLGTTRLPPSRSLIGRDHLRSDARFVGCTFGIASVPVLTAGYAAVRIT